jgi:hypothetical protein
VALLLLVVAPGAAAAAARVEGSGQRGSRASTNTPCNMRTHTKTEGTHTRQQVNKVAAACGQYNGLWRWTSKKAHSSS